MMKGIVETATKEAEIILSASSVLSEFRQNDKTLNFSGPIYLPIK